MKIVCQKGNGEQISFGWFPPLWIISVTGIGSDFNVYTSKNSGQDGENYNGSDATKRNIVIALDVEQSDYAAQRNLLYNFFQPRSEGTLFLYDDTIAKKIGYQVEKIVPTSGETYQILISLICPNPKFYALTDEITNLAMWKGGITFPFRIHEPFVVASKINTLIGNVYNGSNVTQGLTIKFSATGTVVNPSLYDVNRHLMMQINTTMHSGDIITVATEENDKSVKLSSGGVESNINNLMLYPPVWLKAYEGDNLYRYNATSGIDSLSVSILHTQAYWGA